MCNVYPIFSKTNLSINGKMVIVSIEWILEEQRDGRQRNELAIVLLARIGQLLLHSLCKLLETTS